MPRYLLLLPSTRHEDVFSHDEGHDAESAAAANVSSNAIEAVYTCFNAAEESDDEEAEEADNMSHYQVIIERDLDH